MRRGLRCDLRLAPEEICPGDEFAVRKHKRRWRRCDPWIVPKVLEGEWKRARGAAYAARERWARGEGGNI